MPARPDRPYHVLELVLSGVQRLPDALGEQDLVAESLLAEGHRPAGHDHHLPALVLQHGHLGDRRPVGSLLLPMHRTSVSFHTERKSPVLGGGRTERLDFGICLVLAERAMFINGSRCKRNTLLAAL